MNNQLLVHGGSTTLNGAPTDTLIGFSLSGNGSYWYLSSGPKLWGHTAITTADKAQMFVYGGRDNTLPQSSLYSYSAATNAWTTIKAVGCKFEFRLNSYSIFSRWSSISAFCSYDSW